MAYKPKWKKLTQPVKANFVNQIRNALHDYGVTNSLQAGGTRVTIEGEELSRVRRIISKVKPPRGQEAKIFTVGDEIHVLIRPAGRKNLGRKAFARREEGKEDAGHERSWYENIMSGETLPPLDKERSSKLVKMLCHENPQDRLEAAVSLGMHKVQMALPALVARLNDPEHTVRYASANALGKLGNYEAVKALGERLAEDESPEVRAMSAHSLGLIASHRGIRRLSTAMLNDSHEGVSQYAASALGDISHENAIEPLYKGLKHSNAKVRFAAAQSLNRLGFHLATSPKEKTTNVHAKALMLFWHALKRNEHGDLTDRTPVFRKAFEEAIHSQLIIDRIRLLKTRRKEKVTDELRQRLEGKMIDAEKEKLHALLERLRRE